MCGKKSLFFRACIVARDNIRDHAMIHVIAIITAKPGKRTELLAAFSLIVPLVHAEKGCVKYGRSAGHMVADRTIHVLS